LAASVAVLFIFQLPAMIALRFALSILTISLSKYLSAAFVAASPGRRGRINDISCLPDGELASVGKPERSYYPK
jgi:hypothetical protein